MDNRIFNVNGRGEGMLGNTLDLCFLISHQHKTIGWRISEDKGFILYWYPQPLMQAFPVPITAITVAPMVWDWLQSKEAEKVILTGWDANDDNDGTNVRGWRVYCEDWGRIGDENGTICAITPAWLWYGK